MSEPVVIFERVVLFEGRPAELADCPICGLHAPVRRTESGRVCGICGTPPRPYPNLWI